MGVATAIIERTVDIVTLIGDYCKRFISFLSLESGTKMLKEGRKNLAITNSFRTAYLKNAHNRLRTKNVVRS
jgi:hypothetical protein